VVLLRESSFQGLHDSVHLNGEFVRGSAKAFCVQLEAANN
jgi:hypothetical protein